MNCSCSNDCGKMTGLHHIGVYTCDIEASVAFYTGIGFDVRARFTQPSGLKIAFIHVGSCILELLEPVDHTAIADRTNGMIDHIAIAVEDIDRLACRLYEAGIRFDTEKPNELTLFDHGSRCIFFKGPSGERLEFFEELKA